MPSFTGTVPNLASVGPVVQVTVGASAPFTQAAAKTGAQVPQPARAVALIDTGASGTVITPGIVQALGIRPIGATRMSTPSTTAPVSANQYNVSIVFPNGVTVGSVVAICAPLGGQPIQCLIGRDVLRHGVLTYIGYINQFTLSF